MESTLFITLTPNEEANLSGGKKKQPIKKLKEPKLIKPEKSRKRSKVSVKIKKNPNFDEINDEINIDASGSIIIEV